MRKPIETGWPAIAGFTAFLSGILCGWLWISGDSPEHFYEQWRVLIWGAGAIVGLCILAELARLKCPYCMSRAIVLLSWEEVDRWLGQKLVTENTFSVGAFQTVGQSKFKGMTESIAVGRRMIPVTKRCILEKHGCRTCERAFDRRVVEEMR
jgi:hypothetical protein